MGDPTRGDWCSESGFLRDGRCRNPDGCTCEAVATLVARAEAAETANAALTARLAELVEAGTLAMSDLEMAFKPGTTVVELIRLGTGACIRLRAILASHGKETT